ncbi:MAG: hypothetical protein M1817_002863 [Caeruleum heppii]|nr:MAG: hypothetical protein M1817_002863 [Caeruleum heppii]
MSPPRLQFANNVGSPEVSFEYCKGGFHPVDVDDVVDDRYKVVRKLGYGSYSTVWLAEKISNKDYVAIKIVKADYSKRSKELEILRFINGIGKSEEGTSYLPVLLDDFYIQGPNGSHLCLVLPVMGPSLRMLKDVEAIRPSTEYDASIESEDYPVPISMSRSISKQILLALDCLHRHGIVHGDLYCGNILISPDPNRLSSTKIDLRTRGVPVTVYGAAGPKIDGTPPRVILAAEYVAELCVLDGATTVRVFDLGAAFFLSQQPEFPSTCLPNRAPEVILGSAWDVSVDLWGFGCVLYELVTGRRLFSMPFCRDDAMQLAIMEDVLGDYPVIYPGRDTYIQETGERTDEGGAVMEPDAPLEKRLDMEKRDDLSDRDAQDLLQVLRSIFDYDPKKRPTASRLLEYDWFKQA